MSFGGYCSEKYGVTLDEAKINVKYCDCNGFGVVLKNLGETTGLSKCSSAQMSNSTITSFDTLSELFATFIGNFAITETLNKWQPTVGSNDYNNYIAFFNKAKELFDNSNSPITKNISYDITNSAIIGINKQFSITFGTEGSPEFIDLQTVVSRLFGFSNVSTFTEYAQNLVNAYIQNSADASNITNAGRLKYDGTIYTNNGYFILPFAFNNELSNPVLAYVMLDSYGTMSIWINNVESALVATNLNNVISDGSISQITVNGRCMLFETPLVNYTYNANGIRHTKTVNGVTTHYLTNGTQILGQYDGNLMMFYYGVDGITGFSYNGTNYTYKKNILGDIIGIYKEDVEIVRYMYDGFGVVTTKILANDNKFVDIDYVMEYNENVISALEEQEKETIRLVINDRKFIAEINPFRYRGYYYDIETGLYYLNSRYYDPEIGRFINADDVSILNTSKDEINGLNLYAYCFNNPINDIDTNGNWSLKKFLKSRVGKILIGVTVIVVAAALTVATAGGFAAAGTAFAGVLGIGTGTTAIGGMATFMASVTIGAITGAFIGAVAGGFSSWVSGGNVWDGVANGFMWGAISGAVSGGLSYFKFGGLGNLSNKYTGKVVGNIIQSFMQGFVALGTYVARSLVEGEKITAIGSLLSFGSGFVGGLIYNTTYQIQFTVTILSELSNILLELFKKVSHMPENSII